MGFSVSTQPTYIYQTRSGYFFRLCVPKDLKPLVGKTEFRYSLRSAGMQTAKHRARSIASFIHELFIMMRENMEKYNQETITDLVKDHIRKVTGNEKACDTQTARATPGSIIVNGEKISDKGNLKGSNGEFALPYERVMELVQQYVRETLSNDERCRAIGGTLSTETITLDGRTSLEGSNMGAAESQSLLKSVKRWLQVPDHSLMHPVTERILGAEGISIDPESETYKQLSRELLIAFQSVLKVRIIRSEGDYSQPDEEELVTLLKHKHTSSFEPSEASTEEPPAACLKFSDLQERYVKEVEVGESWTEKTKSENLSIFELFIRVNGDLTVDKITREVIADYKSTLMQLPPNMNKSNEYRDKSINDIIALKPKTTLSVNTINKYIRRLGGLFNYASKCGFMPSNPAEGQQIKRSKRKDEERDAYTAEDLKKLFGSREYTNGYHKHSYGFWTPLIGLYSGCRLEEICQLHIEDIRKEDGVWIFDINDNDQKRLKNQSSKRIIPIHSDLIKLGLLDHSEALKKRGEKRLFPELKQTRDGYGQVVSKWFARYRERCGIIGKGKTFHSFRHTFITHLKYKQIDPFMIHELDGHAIDTEYGRYAKRYTPDILRKEAIEKIDYGLDLESIKR